MYRWYPRYVVTCTRNNLVGFDVCTYYVDVHIITLSFCERRWMRWRLRALTESPYDFRRISDSAWNNKQSLEATEKLWRRICALNPPCVTLEATYSVILYAPSLAECFSPKPWSMKDPRVGFRSTNTIPASFICLFANKFPKLSLSVLLYNRNPILMSLLYTYTLLYFLRFESFWRCSRESSKTFPKVRVEGK